MQKFIKFSFIRLIVGLLFVGLPYFTLQISGLNLIKSSEPLVWQERFYKTILFLALGIIVTLLYRIYFKIIEKKPFYEFSGENLRNDIRNGVLFTLLIAAISVLILYFNNNLEISRGKGPGYLSVAFGLAFMSSIAEEILFRGLLFRLSEEYLGTYFAIAVNSFLFGIAHYANPGATVLSALAIGLESGLILSAAYVLTRKLWLNISIHFTWNFIAGVMGFHYAGKTANGIFDTKLTGSKLLTGGEFGIEFSVLIVATGVVLGILLISIVTKKGLIIKPFWKRTTSDIGIAAIGARN